MIGKRKLKSRYRFENGVACIEVRVKNSRQLFDDRDPAPFREKDLDDDLVNYIVTAFEEISSSFKSKLVVYNAESEEESIPTSSLVSAVHSFFEFEVWLTGRRLRKLFHQGQKSLLIGLSCLFIFIYLSHWVGEQSKSLYATMFHEGLAIMGWVAMWKPIDILLYSWWPILGSRKNFQKLSKIDVEVHYNSK